MKQTFNKLSNGLLAILFLSMVMLIFGALTSCSPKFVLPAPDSTLTNLVQADDPFEITANAPSFDSLGVRFYQADGSFIYISLDSLMISEKIVVDTIVIAGEEYVVHDSIPCPGGLERDSFVNFTITRALPSRSVPLSITVLDTVYITKTKAAPVLAAKAADMSWPERILWLLGVGGLLMGYYLDWRKRA